MNKLFVLVISLICFTYPAYSIGKDFIVEEFLLNKNIEKPIVNDNYNYQSTKRLPIKMTVLTPIKSEKDIFEGDNIELKVMENVFIDKKIIIKKNTICTARVETIIKNGMNGIPASIILGNFYIPDIDSNKLQNKYEKFGFDLSLLVYPIKWVLTPLPPLGSLTNFIKGGHAKISKKDIITIKYYPNQS